jgi:hypothetical protein
VNDLRFWDGHERSLAPALWALDRTSETAIVAHPLTSSYFRHSMRASCTLPLPTHLGGFIMSAIVSKISELLLETVWQKKDLRCRSDPWL